MNNTSIVACAKKVKFASAKGAMRALGRIVKKHPERGEMEAYRCGFCRSFHIGHKVHDARRL